MHYNIQISEPPRFKFTEDSTRFILEQVEESKSSSESSLITEEDTSGNPFPPEVIEIHKKTKRLQKDLTNGLMNFKSTSRSVLASEDESRTPLSRDPREESSAKLELSQAVSSNEALRNVLDKILQLQTDYEQARIKLIRNEEEISEKEKEFFQLRESLKGVEEEISVDGKNSGCSCLLI